MKQGRHVPIYAGSEIVGHAFETPAGAWAARMLDGTPLGLHDVLIDARAAILARYHAPGHREPVSVSGRAIP